MGDDATTTEEGAAAGGSGMIGGGGGGSAVQQDKSRVQELKEVCDRRHWAQPEYSYAREHQVCVCGGGSIMRGGHQEGGPGEQPEYSHAREHQVEEGECVWGKQEGSVGGGRGWGARCWWG